MENLHALSAVRDGLQDAGVVEPLSLEGTNINSIEPLTLDAVRRLREALDSAGIRYCHWKSNDVLERSASGENDLDLLVSRADGARFAEILHRLGFKQAQAPAGKQMPGVLDYYGYDSEADRLLHVHAHYQLILGHDMTKSYSLPIEGLYLESAVQGDLFRVPDTDLEFIVFVIRMVLKHSTWDTMLIKHGRLSAAEQRELAYLQARVDEGRVAALLQEHLPYFQPDLFERCLQALEPGQPAWERIRTGHRLQTALKPYTRRSRFQDTTLKLWRRLAWGLQRRLAGHVPKRRLMAGGAVIAIVGGDGAGKTTVVDELYSWLSSDFDTIQVHMGKPPWSRTTNVVRGALSLGRRLGLYPHINSSILYKLDGGSSEFRGRLPWMLREVCKARDRYLAYARAKRYAINGGLVVCDRFPLPQIKMMDSAIIGQVVKPSERGRLERSLIEMERGYYPAIAWPGLVIVLRLDPEIAVARKTDEDSTEVWIRSTEIWEIDWRRTRARVIDAQRSRTEVLTELKSLIWSEL